MLRAVLSGDEAKNLLNLQSVQYVGLQFPTLAQNRNADFVVLRIFEGELCAEWQAGFYCFDADITRIEEAIQACTAKLSDTGSDKSCLATI